MINSNFDKLSQIGKNNFDRGKLLKESSDPCLTGIPEYAVSCVGTNAYTECTYAITGYTYVSMCIGGGSYGDPGTYYPKLIDDPHNNGNGSITTKMTMPPPPEIPITDIIKYLSCFDKSKPASLTIYAEKIATSFPGHAFISIKQGSNTMVLGFYPKESFPSTVSGPGIMGDNGEHAYNSATNYGDISAEKLQKIIDTIIKFSSSNYILTNNNCANFVLEVLKIMGVTDMTGICTPDNIYDITKPYATSMNGKAPKTQRTCN
ncbi:hypothetical protein ASE74_12490 [Pedobacter sp. Leaf216]|uniref:hypothetical protein n=1 Tax=Pedobacter sp. Leaf216 TaxID=1735684 RepID=UPI0006F8A96A|nr:hypothetical protein [Pedobacter sp. Leaf216]KQM78777.1 hypothetical protein ASE74_12490 [Pedobacter sp. Leaf216]